MPTNLEYFRKQAKALLKAALAGDASALQRIGRTEPKLTDAQFAIARELGFASWPRFRAFIVQSGLDDQSLIDSFIDAAVSDFRRAEELLAAHPAIAGGGYYVALVLGDVGTVEQSILASPELATSASGPQKLEPLLYVCFSRYANPRSDRAAGLVETARLLLRHGANPDASFTPEDLPGNPLSCLYGATGLNNNPDLARLLLEAGANPNDNESLYHSTEHADHVCVKLLLDHGASAAGTNILRHMLDREDLEGLRLLLAAGADPHGANLRGETPLHWAVWRGRSAAIISELLDQGVDIDAQRKDGRSAYALATQGRQSDVAALLARRGANTQLSPLDRYLAGETAIPPEAATDPGNEHLLPDLASNHHTSAVRALLAAGVPIDARGKEGATALHWACWKGYADLVELLLAHGASLTIEDHTFHGTPPGWFGHGIRNCGEGGGDYTNVARLLLAAGAQIPAHDLPTGNPEVDAVLREHGVI